MNDEDRWALLAGNWSGDQLDEYDDYGEGFREALLALHVPPVGDEEEEEEEEEGPEEDTPREVLEAILEEAEEPLYLFLEVGRARALDDDLEGAEDALREFLERADEDTNADALLGAYASLAALRDQADDEESAIAEFSAAMDAIPDDPRPFFLMGRYLLGKGHAGEAADVLEAAVPLLPEGQVDWRFLETLGLALFEADRPGEAAEYFDQVLGYFVALRRHDAYPPATAVTRAKIYEDDGEPQKAADLYRSLANGHDVEKSPHLSSGGGAAADRARPARGRAQDARARSRVGGRLTRRRGRDRARSCRARMTDAARSRSRRGEAASSVGSRSRGC